MKRVKSGGAAEVIRTMLIMNVSAQGKTMLDGCKDNATCTPKITPIRGYFPNTADSDTYHPLKAIAYCYNIAWMTTWI